MCKYGYIYIYICIFYSSGSLLCAWFQSMTSQCRQDRQESPPPGHFARIRELSPFAASELPTLHDMAAELSTKATEFSAKAQATATELSAKATEFSAKAQATATELSARAQATATELSAKVDEKCKKQIVGALNFEIGFIILRRPLFADRDTVS